MKRKLEYKQAYLHDTIRPEKVIAALQYLKNNNPEYTDININENWIKTWQEVDPDLYDGIFETEEDQERDEMDTEDQPQISHERNENISADCHESDPEKDTLVPLMQRKKKI